MSQKSTNPYHQKMLSKRQVRWITNIVGIFTFLVFFGIFVGDAGFHWWTVGLAIIPAVLFRWFAKYVTKNGVIHSSQQNKVMPDITNPYELSTADIRNPNYFIFNPTNKIDDI